ncbi:MAG: TadE/TadG family type IV pilus assembly protein [Sulfobacillus sp.]
MAKTHRFAPDRQSGQAAVEFALILPLLVLLLVGVVQVGAILSAALTLQMAAAEGARVAITGATNAQIATQVDQVASDLPAAGLVITITPSGARQAGSNVTVSVSYQAPVLFGTLAGLWGSTIPVSGSATMGME